VKNVKKVKNPTTHFLLIKVHEENGNIPPQPLEKQYFNMEDLIALEARASQTITDSHLKKWVFSEIEKAKQTMPRLRTSPDLKSLFETVGGYKK